MPFTSCPPHSREVMMTDGTEKLHSTTDAQVWADEFCKRWTCGLCQIPGKAGVETPEDWNEIMVGWFANAIMAGMDSALLKGGDDG